jgi:hypothetical protein
MNQFSQFASIFTRVGTYVQRGSKFCFVVVVVVVLGVTVIAQNIAFLSNFTMHSAALLGSLARQPCPAALHCMRARQPCPAAFPGSLARQPCTACVSGSLDRQFDQFRPDLMRARARSLCSHRTVLQWQVTKLHARAAVLTGLSLFLVNFTMLSLTACARCCPADRFKLVQLFLCRPILQFLPACTYVQRGSTICFVVVVVLLLLGTLVRILQYIQN